MQLYLNGLVIKDGLFVEHLSPILIPCNYAKFGNAIVLFLRAALLQHLSQRGVAADVIALIARRIQLVTRETRAVSDDAFGNRLMSHTPLTAPQADVIIATSTMQAGVSIEVHFKYVFGFFHTGVGSFTNQFQAVERLRYGLDADHRSMSKRMILFLERGNATLKAIPEGVLWERAHHQHGGQSDYIKAAMVSTLLEEWELKRWGPAVWANWLLQHGVSFRPFNRGADTVGGRAMVPRALRQAQGGTRPAPMSPDDCQELAGSAFASMQQDLLRLMQATDYQYGPLLADMCRLDGHSDLASAISSSLVSELMAFVHSFGGVYTCVRARFCVCPSLHPKKSFVCAAESIPVASQPGHLMQPSVRDGTSCAAVSPLLF